MQETKTRAPADEEPPASRPSWIRIVAIAVALAMLGGVLYATWQTVATSGTDPEPGGERGGASEPDFSLTDEEVLKRFAQLRMSAFNATKSRDISGVPLLFTAASPAKDRLLKEIQQLKDSDVVEKSSFERIRQEVIENSATEIQIREQIKFFPCFVSPTGENVTVGPGGIEQELIWTLRVEGSEWLLHDSQLQEDRRIEDEIEPCR